MRDDIRENGDGDFRRVGRADIKAYGRRYAGNRIVTIAECLQSLDTFGMCLAAAQSTDIETAGIDGPRKRKIVELRIMAEGAAARCLYRACRHQP